MGRQMEITARVNVYGADAEQLAANAKAIGDALAGAGNLRSVTFENVNATGQSQDPGEPVTVSQWAGVAVLVVDITTDAPAGPTT